MKPKKVMCPICGEEMWAISWGMKKQASSITNNYVNYECTCGCRLYYEGKKNCWQKCKCKSCVNFQDHYPYHEKGCECEYCKRGKNDV